MYTNTSAEPNLHKCSSQATSQHPPVAVDIHISKGNCYTATAVKIQDFRNKISRKWRNGESTIGGGAHLRRPAAARMRRVANWAKKN